MTRLYRAIDSKAGIDTLYMIGEHGCNISNWFPEWTFDENINAAMGISGWCHYGDMSWFDDAIDPVLIAEW